METMNIDEIRKQTPDFFCPISLCMMTNPYIDDNGHSFQKEEIETWLSNSDRSPITNEHYKSTRIRPNIGLRNAIEKWCNDNNFDPTNPLKMNETRVHSMVTYNNSEAPCFYGNNYIEMDNNMIKLIKNLKKDDIVKTLNGSSKVKCIVKIKCKDIKVNMVTINGLFITPWHPIFMNKWIFPFNVGRSVSMKCWYLYNIVLEQNHTVIVNGNICVTLGHGFTDNDVVRHPYFGTSKVIDDLKKLNGWDDGLVIFDDIKIVRDNTTKLVCGIE